MKLQNTATANRLKTMIQKKKAMPRPGTPLSNIVEAQQGDDEEAIHRRQEHPPREAADQPAVHRLQHQHDHEHAGEQELQDEILQRDAMTGEPGNQHGGNTVSRSAEAAIASRTGRST
jgi:E3 ubiquitin-protein ligase DOA10